jgi:diguanylate cyclase (GGDEF)-like protein/putative nucleotidyltransferase with HDIG domain
MSDTDQTASSPPLRLRGFVLAVIAATVPVAAAAVVAIASSPPSRGSAVGALLFCLLALAADLKPVPLDESGERNVSLAFVFILAMQILFGWEYATLGAFVATLASQLTEPTNVLRISFNTAVYGLSAFASALPVFIFGFDPVGVAGTDYNTLALLAFVGGACYVVLNVILVCLAVSFAHGVGLRSLLLDNLNHYGPAFVIMAFMATLAALLWTVEPHLELLLAGPLMTLALYQRYATKSERAERDAHYDALTGLRNHRSFQQELGEALEIAAVDGGAVALCLIDIDNFKSINDRFGHPIGDDVLRLLGETLTAESVEGVTAYRMGGEEFALLMPGWEEAAAYQLVEAVHARLWDTHFPHGEPVTVSAGIASYPRFAADREELLRAADGALYWAKNHGKNRSCIFSPSIVRIVTPEELERNAERQARLRAAEGLIRVVDAKDAYVGEHSQSVSRLTEGIARTMGLDEATVEKVRLAGLLHDVGKIAIPRDLLQKLEALTEEEVEIIRQHPALGARLLEGLGLEPVEEWIRHHHERWDGSGYPDALAGDDIPLGARIVHVADAYEAMTTERTYREAREPAAAIAELRRKSWQQFDARVVAALEQFVRETDGEAPDLVVEETR